MATAYKTLGRVTPNTSVTASTTVSNKALASSVATLTTGTAHGFAIGDVVTIYGVDSTFDGTYAIATIPLTTTFTYARNTASVASTAVSPVGMVLRQANLGGQTSSNIYCTNGVSTLSTASSHGLNVGDWLRVTTGNTNMDGLVRVLAVPSSTTVMYQVAGATSVASTALSTGAFGRTQASVWSQVYAPPASASAVASTLNITNTNASAAQYRVAVSTTASPTVAEVRLWDSTVPANDSVFLTLGWVIQEGYRMMVQANAPGITFSVDGSENTP
jgi:hypothetical protein